MIKAVIFDIGEVITTGDFNSAYDDFAKRIGVKGSIVSDYYKENLDELLTGKITTLDTLKAFKVDKKISPKLALEIWRDEILRNSLVNKSMLSLLNKLRPEFKIIALSNVTESRIEADIAMGLYDYFDSVVLSFREKLMKPDSAFFQIALDKAACSASEAVFVDDQEKQVEAARNMGINAIRFIGYDELVVDLKSFGIKIT